MTEPFQPGCLATLIGSLPLTDHGDATDLIFEQTPEIPFWAQLPIRKAEGMLSQFILYPEQIKSFIDSGKNLAWGVVPTLNPDDIERQTVESVWGQWMEQLKQVEALGIDMQKVISRSLITPSCGMGSLGLDYAEKVIRLTKAISRKARKLYPK